MDTGERVIKNFEVVHNLIRSGAESIGAYRRNSAEEQLRLLREENTLMQHVLSSLARGGPLSVVLEEEAVPIGITVIEGEASVEVVWDAR